MSLLDGYKISQEISTVLKIYPDFVRLYKYKTPFYIRRYDYDPISPKRERKTNIIQTEEAEISSRNRAKTALQDMALCNKFDLFVTFTFNNKKKDRHDVDAIKKRMAFWLNNQRILHGKFKYLIVPEYHKDGALHFHGLFHGYKGNLVDSGKRWKERTVYNIKSYKAGFTTAVKIEADGINKVASYVTKYITKEMPKFKGKQRYWCSNGLKRPLKIINPLIGPLDEFVFTETYRDKLKVTYEFKGQLPDKDILRLADYGRRREDDLWADEL